MDDEYVAQVIKIGTEIERAWQEAMRRLPPLRNTKEPLRTGSVFLGKKESPTGK